MLHNLSHASCNHALSSCSMPTITDSQYHVRFSPVCPILFRYRRSDVKTNSPRVRIQKLTSHRFPDWLSDFEIKFYSLSSSPPENSVVMPRHLSSDKNGSSSDTTPTFKTIPIEWTDDFMILRRIRKLQLKNVSLPSSVRALGKKHKVKQSLHTEAPPQTFKKCPKDFQVISLISP